MLWLTCDGELSGTDLTVRPQPDGERVGIGWTYADGSGGGDGLEPGLNDLVFQAGPGRLELDCPKASAQGTPPRIRVEDQDGLWIDPTLSCDAQSDGFIDYVEPPVFDDPERAAEQLLDPIGSQHVVQAGYPDADERIYILRDVERQVASVEMSETPHGWMHGAISSC